MTVDILTANPDRPSNPAIYFMTDCKCTCLTALTKGVDWFILKGMSLKICSLASGSKGNCTLIASPTTKILVDAGLTLADLSMRILKTGVRLEEVDAVVLTHRHSDHTAGLGALSKKFGLPIYTHGSNAAHVRKEAKDSEIIEICGEDFFVGDITLSPFEVSHDVHCYGYSFYCFGRKITYMTDLGLITPQIINASKDSDIVLIESNHDEDRLIHNRNYPPALKRRILGSCGHLSNAATANAVIEMVRGGVRQIILAHLSEENNCPELVFARLSEALTAAGLAEGKDVLVDVALQDSATRIFEIA